MFELLFVISFPTGETIKEFFPDKFASIIECQDKGWQRAERLSYQIKQKYPEMSGFYIECKTHRESLIEI